jgi:hypothetical protein
MEALESSTTARSVLLGADEIGPEGARAGTYQQTSATAWRVSDHCLLTAACVVALGLSVGQALLKNRSLKTVFLVRLRLDVLVEASCASID